MWRVTRTPDAVARGLLGRASLAGAGTVFQQGILFLSGLIIARVLGAAEYGVVNLARNLVDTTSIVTRLGLEIGLQRFFGETRDGMEQRIRLAVLRRLRLIAAAVALLPLLAVVLGLGRVLEDEVYRYTGFAQVLLCLALALPFATDMAVLAGAYRGVLKLGPAIVAECVLMPGVRLVIIVLLFLAGWRLWAVALGSTLGSLLAAAWLARRARGDFPALAPVASDRPRCRAEARRVLGYSGVLAAAVLVTTLTASMDLLLLGHYVSAAQLGQYSLAKTLLLVIGLPALAFNQGLGALVAERWFRGDVAGMLRVLSLTFRWLVLCCLPLCALFLLRGDWLLQLFGASFTLAPPALAWLAIGQLVQALFGPMGWALSMTGRHVLELRVLVAGLLLAVLLCLLLIPRFGQLGAAIASCGAITFTNLARLLCIRRSLGVWPFTFGGSADHAITGPA